jgi:hypothetical protein
MSTHATLAAEVDRMMRRISIIESDLMTIDSEPQFWRHIERATVPGGAVAPAIKYIALAP